MFNSMVSPNLHIHNVIVKLQICGATLVLPTVNEIFSRNSLVVNNYMMLIQETGPWGSKEATNVSYKLFWTCLLLIFHLLSKFVSNMSYFSILLDGFQRIFDNFHLENFQHSLIPFNIPFNYKH